jgi:hypothetical protein
MAICKSINGGASWSRCELSTTQGEVYALALHPTDSNILFAGGYCGENNLGHVLKSSDGGVHWSDASSGLAQNYNYVYALAIDPTAPQNMYAGCNNGIFKSTDGGVSWRNLDASFAGVSDIIIRSSPPTIYAASSYAGIHSSVDGGTHWSALNEGLTTLQIECLALDPVNHLLYAGTNGGGVFRRDISTDVETARPQPELPTRFGLGQIYPNPFNPATTIDYQIAETVAGPVSLKIFNMTGQLIKTLVNGKQPPGQYRAIWEGTDENGVPVGSGIYICVLNAGEFIGAMKMTLIR